MARDQPDLVAEPEPACGGRDGEPAVLVRGALIGRRGLVANQRRGGIGPSASVGCRPVADLRLRPGLPVSADANRGPQDANGGGECRHPLVALLAYCVRQTSGIVDRYEREQLDHGCDIFGIHKVPDESASPGDRRACTKRLFCRYRGAHRVLVQSGGEAATRHRGGNYRTYRFPSAVGRPRLCDRHASGRLRNSRL